MKCRATAKCRWPGPRIAALLVPPLLVLAGLHRLALADIFSSWTDDSRARRGRPDPARPDHLFAAAGRASSLVVALIVSLPAVRRVMTPRFLQAATGCARWRGIISRPPARGCPHAEPHILIYASLADRQVELVAHDAIHQAVGEGPWNAAVAAVTRRHEGRAAGATASSRPSRSAARRWRRISRPMGRPGTCCPTPFSRHRLPQNNEGNVHETADMRRAMPAGACRRQPSRP